ncbi:proteasome regulatory particle subunit [Coccomyxa viridis]|uniref:26S proteasome regulatory subunit RPN7 n=1 Tax=Coccomyxa viridis TaxID=1274662 RepID=A0AAV1HXI4_9CHLO|nr:proteasome regulatory particle subunit [Coccomyxa viridis]
MRKANEEQLSKFEASIKDAEENLGDIEVRDAFLAKADYLYKIGDQTAAKDAYTTTEQKTAGVGQKMDLAFSMLRLDMAYEDWHSVKTGLKAANELCASGGDWERKNRLKVYEASYLMATRDLAGAAKLFLDSIATFTSSELFSYETCIFYTVLTSVPTLDRVSLKSKVVDAPEILTVIESIPHLSTYLNALYKCQYADFFKAFAAIADQVREDIYLHRHLRYYVREVRVVAYSQFLDSYKSVTLSSMADAFGVSVDFIDGELVEFIVAGRLPAKIDKVAGVIETTRPDAKNAQYQSAIKHGDLLLNRLQKLSKVIDDTF